MPVRGPKFGCSFILGSYPVVLNGLLFLFIIRVCIINITCVGFIAKVGYVTYSSSERLLHVLSRSLERITSALLATCV